MRGLGTQGSQRATQRTVGAPPGSTQPPRSSRGPHGRGALTLPIPTGHLRSRRLQRPRCKVAPRGRPAGHHGHQNRGGLPRAAASPWVFDAEDRQLARNRLRAAAAQTSLGGRLPSCPPGHSGLAGGKWEAALCCPGPSPGLPATAPLAPVPKSLPPTQGPHHSQPRVSVPHRPKDFKHYVLKELANSQSVCGGCT